MIRPSILSITLAIILFTSNANSQVTYTDNGSNNTYTLSAGDSLSIASGSFTGTINSWVAGSKITVAAGAAFRPSSFNDNKSKVIVYGTAVLPSFYTGAGFDLKNYGNITITGATGMNGGAQTWTNFYGATLTFNGQMAINFDGSSLINNGTITANNDFYLYSTSTITNNNSFTVKGNFNTSRGQLNNGGRFYSNGKITISGATTFTNTCRTVAEKGITIDHPSSVVYNNGMLWASNVNSNATLTNSGTIINGANGKIKSVDLLNYGTINGKGIMYFTGSTTASGTIGAAGVTTDTIKVYDVSRSNPATIFDNQWGTIRPNVIYKVMTAPDTSSSPYSTCASLYISGSGMALLPITWNYFYANLVHDVPVLDWSAEHTPGTRYEIQRSYDNHNFTAIATIASENKTIYQYQDAQADNSKAIVYYRIKGIELSGDSKFTEVRLVKFASRQQTAVQVMPNPFTTAFTVNYEGTSNDQLVIKVYNSLGQTAVIKKVTTTAGINHITVNEAATLSKGIYIVEIANGAQVTGTQKIIKN